MERFVLQYDVEAMSFFFVSHITLMQTIQPAVKCRVREYLRIIYGPEYTLPENLGRLRQRSLGRKRSLALREFALGIEAGTLCKREPLYRSVNVCLRCWRWKANPLIRGFRGYGQDFCLMEDFLYGEGKLSLSIKLIQLPFDSRSALGPLYLLEVVKIWVLAQTEPFIVA